MIELMMKKKNEIIEKVMRGLDLSPTMFQNATEKYKNIADYLEESGIKANFYPQGSFRLGTVIRPYREGEDSDYDLDVICCIEIEKEKTTAEHIKNDVGDTLKSNKIYRDRLEEEHDKCWTIQYANITDNVGFKLDIVPSVEQDQATILELISNGIEEDKANEAITITDKQNDAYYWSNSNPRGYAKWFDEINEVFLEHNINEQRDRIYKENKAIYSSIEEVPVDILRTPLQRTIQILKRHRDIYYTRSNKLDNKPISAIITTLSALFAKNLNPSISTFDMLEYVVKKIGEYSSLLAQNGEIVNVMHITDNLIVNNDTNKWIIKNPVDPNDNYADNWDNETAKLFFKWSNAINNELLVDTLNEDEFVKSASLIFGESAVRSSIPNRINVKANLHDVSETKPWKGRGLNYL